MIDVFVRILHFFFMRFFHFSFPSTVFFFVHNALNLVYFSLIHKVRIRMNQNIRKENIVQKYTEKDSIKVNKKKKKQKTHQRTMIFISLEPMYISLNCFDPKRQCRFFLFVKQEAQQKEKIKKTKYTKKQNVYIINSNKHILFSIIS